MNGKRSIGSAGGRPVRRGEEHDFVRLPGLFRLWEVARVITTGRDFHFESAGATADGTPLLAVYERESEDGEAGGRR